MPDGVVFIVLFERPTHWTGYLTQLYQFLNRKPYWRFVHCVVYTRLAPNSQCWFRSELTWDGVVDDEVGGTVVEDSDALVVPLFRFPGYAGVHNRAITIQRTNQFLGGAFRYHPLLSLVHVATGAYQWNCSSIVSYILGYDTPHHLPSDLLKEVLNVR
jgi:hypothetical protein